jgi:DNA topoisomerase VI subunit A
LADLLSCCCCPCRLFLRKLKLTLKIPVLALVDSDPYGLKILSVYMKGSMNMSYDSRCAWCWRRMWLICGERGLNAM